MWLTNIGNSCCFSLEFTPGYKSVFQPFPDWPLQLMALFLIAGLSLSIHGAEKRLQIHQRRSVASRPGSRRRLPVVRHSSLPPGRRSIKMEASSSGISNGKNKVFHAGNEWTSSPGTHSISNIMHLHCVVGTLCYASSCFMFWKGVLFFYLSLLHFTLVSGKCHQDQ